MRNGAAENKVLNEAFLICADIVSRHMIHSGLESQIAALCETCSSVTVSNHLKFAFDLFEHGYASDVIDVLLEYEFQKMDRTTIHDDELKTIVILNKLLTRLVQYKDFDFFNQLFSAECPGPIREELTKRIYCGPDFKKDRMSLQDAAPVFKPQK